MKIFIKAVHIPKQEYHLRDQGARVTILAEDEAEANRLLEGILPSGLDVNSIAMRSLVREARWAVYDATGYVELNLTDGYKNVSLTHSRPLGLL